MSITICENITLPVRRDGQIGGIINYGSMSSSFGGGSTGGSSGTTYTAGNGITIAGTVISANFGTTSTTVACGSHTHTGYLPVAGCAADSAKLNNQLASYYAVASHNHAGIYLPIGGTAVDSDALGGQDASYYAIASHTHAGYLLTTGCACDSKCFGAQEPSYYATATHLHGNITANGCIGGISGCVLVTTTNGCITVASTATPSSHAHGCITNDGKIGTTSGYILCTTIGGIIALTTASSLCVGCAGTATIATSATCATNAVCLNGQLASFYATAAHTHSNYACSIHATNHITGNDRIPIFTCTCRGTVPPPNNTDGQSMLFNDGTWKTIGSISGITDTQYLQFQGYGSGALTNGSAYYWGNASRLSTSVSLNKVYVPQSGTLKKLYAYGNFGTIGNSCAICMWVVKNGTTCCIIDINCSASASRCWVSTNMSLPITAGDYLEIKTISCAGAGAVYFNATAQLTSEITPFINSNVSELFFDSAGTPYSINYVCITSNVTWNAYEASPWITLGGCTSGTCNGCFNMTLGENTTELTRYYAVCVIGSGSTGRYIGICQFGCCGECGCYEL